MHFKIKAVVYKKSYKKIQKKKNKKVIKEVINVIIMEFIKILYKKDYKDDYKKKTINYKKNDRKIIVLSLNLLKILLQEQKLASYLKILITIFGKNLFYKFCLKNFICYQVFEICIINK